MTYSEQRVFTTADIGCYLDNHRGHYITRDVIDLAQSYGFIVDPFAQFALDLYGHDDIVASGHIDHAEYPHESIIELCDEAIAWLNGGQTTCAECDNYSHLDGWTIGNVWQPATYDAKGNVSRHGTFVVCRACSGTGRGPRDEGQNFPPIVPSDAFWGFNDGDFGLYRFDDEGEVI